MRFNAIIFIFTLVVFSFSNGLYEFPLWGSTWVFGEGENKRIYPSAARFRPKKVAKVTFLEDKSGALISYANLETTQLLYSTAEAVLEVKRQFLMPRDSNDNVMDASGSIEPAKKEYALSGKIFVPYNEINKKYGALHIVYEPYNDTIWSMHDYANKLFASKYDSCMIRFGTEEKMYYSDIRVDSVNWSKGKPILVAYRKATVTDKEKYQQGEARELLITEDGFTIRQLVYYDIPADPLLAVRMPNYYDAVSNTVVEHYDHRYGVHKTAGLGFWRVHVTPEVWWYPRRADSTSSAVTHESYKRSHRVAMQLREESLGDVTDPNLMRWRNPVLNDSTSVMLSVSFIGAPDQHTAPKIALDSNDPLVRDNYDSDIFYTHIPRRAYRVDSTRGGAKADEYAMIQLSSNHDNDEEDAVNLYLRCPSWELMDTSNGYTIFPTTSGYIEGKYTTTRSRNWDIDDAVFMYDKCPCSQEYLLGDKTPAEMRRYLYKPYPTHSPSIVLRTLRFYEVLDDHLYSEKDKKMLESKIQAGNKIYADLKRLYDENSLTERTRKSWLDDPVVEKILKRNLGI